MYLNRMKSVFHLDECRAIGLASDGELEVADVPSVSEEVDDEHETDLDAINDELQAMKRRITNLEKTLELNLPECPEPEPCIDPEVELNRSKNMEIFALQRDNYKLKVQLCELQKCCNLAKEQLTDLRARHCQEMLQIQRLQKFADQMHSFQLRLEHEFALCIERFEYLKHVKCDWNACITEAIQLRQCFERRTTSHVPRTCYVEDKKMFIDYLDEVKTLCHNLQSHALERFKSIEDRLGIVFMPTHRKHSVAASSSAADMELIQSMVPTLLSMAHFDIRLPKPTLSSEKDVETPTEIQLTKKKTMKD